MKLFSYAIVAIRNGTDALGRNYTETRIMHGVYKHDSEAAARGDLFDKIKGDAPSDDGWRNHNVYTYEITEEIIDVVDYMKKTKETT